MTYSKQDILIIEHMFQVVLNAVYLNKNIFSEDKYLWN